MEIIAKFSVPLRMNKNKHKINWFYCNLNNYTQISKNTSARNAVKQKYEDQMQPILETLPKIDCKVKVIYVIYARNKRLFDVSNVGSIVDKFICDAMVKAGVLPDDNYEYVPRVEYIFGTVDKENPTADVFIIKDEKEEYIHVLREIARQVDPIE